MTRLLLIAAAVLLVALPALADNYMLRVATTMLMYSALALGWNFIGGFAGYPSFATAAFFGLGAYAGGVLQSKGVPMLARTASLIGHLNEELNDPIGFALSYQATREYEYTGQMPKGGN